MDDVLLIRGTVSVIRLAISEFGGHVPVVSEIVSGRGGTVNKCFCVCGGHRQPIAGACFRRLHTSSVPLRCNLPHRSTSLQLGTVRSKQATGGIRQASR